MKLFVRRRQVPAARTAAPPCSPPWPSLRPAPLPSVGAPRHPTVTGRPRCRSPTSPSACRTRTRSRPGWSRRPGHLHSHSVAGVLWLHWLGDLHNDRSEFLSEAVDLAGAGRGLGPPAGLLPVGPEPGRHHWRRDAGRATRSRRTRRCSTSSPATRPSTPTASPSSVTTTAPCTAPCSPTATTGCPCWPCRHRTRCGQLVRDVLARARGPGASRLPRAASPGSTPSTTWPGWARPRAVPVGRPATSSCPRRSATRSSRRTRGRRASPTTAPTTSSTDARDRGPCRVPVRAARSWVAEPDSSRSEDVSPDPGRCTRPRSERTCGHPSPKLKHVLVWRPCGSPTPRR